MSDLGYAGPEFHPKNSFSKEMLISIPRKVGTWLVNLNQEPVGQYNDVAWEFAPDAGVIAAGCGDGDELIVIMWEGDIGKPGDVKIWGSSPQFEDIGANLGYFVQVEQLIYKQLDLLQYHINQKSGTERHILKTAPPRDDEPVDESPIILNAAERFAAQMKGDG